MTSKRQIDALWDDNPVDVTSEANFIWSIANKLRGTYMPDKYGDVIIPMTILRRFECALAPTKAAVIEAHMRRILRFLHWLWKGNLAFNFTTPATMI